MQELSSIGLMPEDWGGDVPMVQVVISCRRIVLTYSLCLILFLSASFCGFKQISALKGKNIDELLETVMLVAEVRQM